MSYGWRIVSLVLLSLLLSSCRTGSDQPAATPLSSQESPLTTPTTGIITGVGVISQWGVSAEASSEFANPEWSASQAVGSPDTPGCGDYQFAWASAASDSIDTLEIKYPRAVYPLEIRIFESFNPDQVVKVEVLDPETGAYYTVLQQNPRPIDRPCPYELEVLVEGIEFRTNLVRITVDQSQLGLGWNEIDAVLLVGSINPPGE